MIIDVNEARKRARAILSQLTIQPANGFHRTPDVDLIAMELVRANGDGMQAIIAPLADLSPFTFDEPVVKS